MARDVADQALVSTPRPGGLALASGGLLAVMLTTLAASGGFALLSKPLWLDEYHTYLVATRQSLADSLRSLAMGADFNPPALHLLYRTVDTIGGGLTPFSMRFVSFLCVWLSLTVAFAIVRRHLASSAAFGAACALWAHPLAITYAFDARFYGPWLLVSALLVWATGVDRQAAVSYRRDIAMALSAVGVCTIHYFGVFVWAVIAVVVVVSGVSERKSRAAIWRFAAPMLSGPLALLACVPFYLGQRRALSTATWVAPVSMAQLVAFLADYVWWIGLFVPLVLWAIVRLVQQWRGERTIVARISTRDRDLVALVALAAVPLIVVVFSVAVQPSLVRRYAIPGLLAWVPVAALILADVPRVVRTLVLAGHVALAVALVRGQVAGVHRDVADVLSDASAIRAQGTGATVVCRTRQRAYALATLADPAHPLGTSVCRFPVFADTTTPAAAGLDESLVALVRMQTVERDVARVHARLYGFPQLSAVEDLRQQAQFYLLDEADTEAFGRLWFPSFTIRRVAPRLFRLSRVAQSAHTPYRAAYVG